MDYDIRAIFEEMELELIASMRRNLARHQRWEAKEGINWTMWQAEQLKTLEQFKKENKKIFEKKFDKVNQEIKKFLKEQYERAGFDQERLILEALANGQGISEEIQKGLEGAFFSLNKEKMNALINASVNDLEKAEHAMLRKTNDEYRKIIYKSQAMANSGAFTLKQSVDKASKDFLRNGIACVQYKDGRLVNIASYAEMAIRTANKRAVLVSEGDARETYGIHTVRISKYGGCSKTCKPWQGKIYVDDVYSGGTKEEAKEKDLKLLSEAMEGGLFHPNCRHRATTYFWDILQDWDKYDDEGNEIDPIDQEHRKNHLKIQQQKRMETGFLDEKNRQEAKDKKEFWMAEDEKIKATDNNRMLDVVPPEFKFSQEKEDNLLAIFAELDKRFMSDGYEHMAIAYSKNGKLINEIVTSHSSKDVQPTEKMMEIIFKAKSKSLISIHNHPSRNPFSLADIIVANNMDSFKETIVINTLGEVYYLAIPGGKEIDLSTEELKDKFRNDILDIRKKCKKLAPHYTTQDINHAAYSILFKELGWIYGRKKY